MSHTVRHRNSHKGKVYALYRGEENVCDGTLAEIAEHEGIKYETARYMTSPCYRRRIAEYVHDDVSKSRAKVLVLIDGEEEE